MPRASLTIFIFLTVCMGTHVSAQIPFYSMTLLEKPFARDLAIPGPVNDSGQSVGVWFDDNGDEHIFRWEPDGSYEYIAGEGYPFFNRGEDINNAGYIVGYLQRDTPGVAVLDGAVWSPTGEMTFLTPQEDARNQRSQASGINSQGQIVGRSDDAVLWNVQGEIIWELGAPDGFAATTGIDINDSGLVLGTASSADKLRPFLWDPESGFEVIEPPSELADETFYPVDQLNSGGQFVGTVIRSSPEDDVALFWDPEIGHVEVTSSRRFDGPFGLSEDGIVVGTSLESSFIWHLDEGQLDIDSRIVNAPEGWELFQTGRFSSNGQFTGLASTTSPESTIAMVVLSPLGEPVLAGDFNHDGQLDAVDIDLLTSELNRGAKAELLDLNSDSAVDAMDRATWIANLAMVQEGDTDFDGKVDFSDFLALSENFGQPGGWSKGNFDGSAEVDFLDFLKLSTNFGVASAAQSTAPVPEPHGLRFFAVLVVIGSVLCRRPRTPCVKSV